MKRALLLLAFLCIARSAPAVIPVLSEVEAAIASNQLVQAVKGYVLETKQYITELEELARVEAMLQGMIQHPSLGAAQAAMGALGISNPLGGIPSAYTMLSMVGGLHSGIGSISGRLGQLGGLLNGIGGINGGPPCQDDTYGCQILQRRYNAATGYQSVLGKLYGDLSDHFEVLRGLRDRQSTATDPAERENLILAVQSEQAWSTAALGQMEAASAMYRAQRDQNEVQANALFNDSVQAFSAKAWAQ